MPSKAGASALTRKRHPIQVVVRRTGLSADVLRAWEKRHAVVRPARSAGGRRMYSDEDVDRLRLLKRATEGGRSIGQVAALDTTALGTLVEEDAASGQTARSLPPDQERAVVEHAVADVRALDAQRLHRRLGRAVVDLPADGFLEGVVTPLLRAIGDGWRHGTLRPAQEHLASGVVRQVLHWVLASVSVPGGGPALVAGTPQGVRHEFGALLAATSAAMAGWDVTYVGADLPAADLAEAVRSRRARVLALSLVPPLDRAAVVEELGRLRGALPRGVDLIVGGAAAPEVADALQALGAVRCGDLASFRAALDAAGGQRSA